MLLDAVARLFGLKNKCSFDRNGGVVYQRITTETIQTQGTTETKAPTRDLKF